MSEGVTVADLEPITARVAELEKGMAQVKTDVAGVKTQVEGIKSQVESVAAQASQVSSDTAAIRKTIVGATKVGTFAKKHGRFAIGLIVGSLYASGFLSPVTFQRFMHALAYVTAPPIVEGNTNAN